MRKKKRPFTLLEILIVIFLIGIIGSVIGYNMKGSLDEGRAFRSRQGIEQLRDIVELQLASGWPKENLSTPEEIKDCITRAGIAKKVDDLMKDGWGDPYVITYNPVKDQVTVKSEKLKKFDLKKNKNLKEANDEERDEEA